MNHRKTVNSTEVRKPNLINQYSSQITKYFLVPCVIFFMEGKNLTYHIIGYILSLNLVFIGILSGSSLAKGEMALNQQLKMRS